MFYRRPQLATECDVQKALHQYGVLQPPSTSARLARHLATDTISLSLQNTTDHIQPRRLTYTPPHSYYLSGNLQNIINIYKIQKSPCKCACLL